MAEIKTKPTNDSVHSFINSIDDNQKRRDCFTALGMMQEITGELPKMWGTSIIGFGQYHYKYASGREGEWFLTGFSPRKHSLTFYIMNGAERYQDLLGRLGRHKVGKACLYVKNLHEIDQNALYTLIKNSVAYMRKKHHLNQDE